MCKHLVTCLENPTIVNLEIGECCTIEYDEICDTCHKNVAKFRESFKFSHDGEW